MSPCNINRCASVKEDRDNLAVTPKAELKSLQSSVGRDDPPSSDVFILKILW